MKTNVIMLGLSFVKPSDIFIVYAQIISKTPAKTRTIQATMPAPSIESGRPDDFSHFHIVAKMREVVPPSNGAIITIFESF